MSSGFYIVNQFDRPDERHVAQEIEGKLYYIHPELAGESQYWGMSMEEATPLEAFGLSCFHAATGMGTCKQIEWLRCSLERPRSATYPDGKLRHWQGASEFRIDLPKVHPAFAMKYSPASFDQAMGRVNRITSTSKPVEAPALIDWQDPEHNLPDDNMSVVLADRNGDIHTGYKEGEWWYVDGELRYQIDRKIITAWAEVEAPQWAINDTEDEPREPEHGDDI